MPSIAKDKLKEILTKSELSEVQRRVAELKLDYSACTTLLNHFVSKLANKDRIFPQVRPTQVTGRYSTTNPPLTNFPKKCINPSCVKERHRKTPQCWSLRDIIMPDEGEFWMDFDADAIEARIYALFLGWDERLAEFNLDLDIHTPVTCALFDLPLPTNFLTCHSDEENESWRAATTWQGKDDKRRTMSKNFTYGGQYFYVELSKRNVRYPNCKFNDLIYNPEFVFSIPDIHQYGLEGSTLITLAHKFIEATYPIQCRKAERMERIKREKMSRTLYGARRVFWSASKETAKEGFNHSIQGTVVDYMNDTEIRLKERWIDSRFIHNAHDGLKWSFPLSLESEVKAELPSILNRKLSTETHEVEITFSGGFIYPER